MAPSIDLTDRILEAITEDDPKFISLRNRRLWRRPGLSGMVASAAAAAAVLAITLQSRDGQLRQVPGRFGPDRPLARLTPEPPVRVDLPALNQALTDASEATWDLAYAASAPAVRLGRTVFDRADPGPSSRSDFIAPGSPGEVISEALNQVGQGISVGVRPLSDSARRALDFLQGAVPIPAEAIDNRPPLSDSKGA